MSKAKAVSGNNKKFYEKLPLNKVQKLWYIFVPLIFAIAALVFSILDIEVQVTSKQGQDKKEYNYYVGTTEVFHSDRYIVYDNVHSDKDAENQSNVTQKTTNDEAELIGDPNIIGIIGCITLILCIIFIPRTMLKVREHGDGLGMLFLPLGLLCINNIMCVFLYGRTIAFGLIFSLACFVVSALATFKKYVNIVGKACIFLLLVAFFAFIASLSPYCYNEIVFYDVSMKQYYISYFIRDIFMLCSFGVFSTYLAKTYDFNK